MPNAFRLDVGPDRLRSHFDLATPPAVAPRLDFYAPGDMVATVEWSVHGLPVMQMAHFGFKMRDGVLPMTNFRSESIDPPAPSRAFLEGRCIVPADFFQEQVQEMSGVRIVAYGAHDARILGMAAMLRPEASGLSVTLLTIPATAVVRSTNRRMPAILCEDDYALWLDDTTAVADALSILRHNHDDLLVERSL